MGATANCNLGAAGGHGLGEAQQHGGQSWRSSQRASLLQNLEVSAERLPLTASFDSVSPVLSAIDDSD